MICRTVLKKAKPMLARTAAAMSSQVTSPAGKDVIQREYLQFSKAKLVDFGELPFG